MGFNNVNSEAVIKLTKDKAEIKLKKDAGFNFGGPAVVGLSWDMVKMPGAGSIDIDVLCILTNGDDANDSCISVDHFLCPWHKELFANGKKVVAISSDNRDGADRAENEYENIFGPAFAGVKTDDEYISIDFQNVPAECKRVIIASTIFEGAPNFGCVDNAFIRVMDCTGREAVRLDLSSDDNISNSTAVVFCQFDRDSASGDWKMVRKNEGYNASIEQLIQAFNVNLAEFANKYN